MSNEKDGEDPSKTNSEGGEDEGISRPESRISQTDDDSSSFHDVVDSEEPPTTTTESTPAHQAVTDEGKEGEQASPPPPPSDPPHVNLASSSTPDLTIAPAEVTTPDELVAFLRGQITDLTSQVTSLNNKLVKSYTTRGELEDDLHETQERGKGLTKRVTELERERERWTKEIEQGGWVERDHVQGEMQRLMTKVVEETKVRETAEQAHSALETEVEALTSNLFAEANKMVAFERLARARAEEKTRSVEEAGISMQALLEDVQVGLRDTVTKLEKREAQVIELKQRLATHGEIVPDDPTDREGMDGGDGAGGGEEGAGSIIFSDGEHLVPSSSTPVRELSSQNHMQSQLAIPRLLTSALPYHEFLTFVTYLRQLRVTTLARPPEPPSTFGHSAFPTRSAFSTSHDPSPNYIHSNSSSSTTSFLSPSQLLAPHLNLTTHLSQPFLKRCVEEDSDPTLRLDLAPGLGFLSRRNVSSAIVDGTLLIEPLSTGLEVPNGEKCTLCGCGLEKWFANSGVTKSTNSTTNGGTGGTSSTTGTGSSTTLPTANQVNQTMRKVFGGGGWGFSRSNSNQNTPTLSSLSSASSNVTSTATTTGTTDTTNSSFSFPNYHPSHHPLDHSLQIYQFRTKDSSTQRYPICPSYCLARLRAVCEFWTYVRVIERGLLLEEGFKFVQGRNETIPVSSSTTSLHSTSKTNLHAAESGRGGAGRGGGEEDRSTSGLEREGSNPGLGIEARDFEAADTEMEGTPRIVEPDPTDEPTTQSVQEETSKEGAETSLPASPSISRPQTPTLLTQNLNSSSGSINKPNRPPRSSARGANGTSSPAIGSNPSPPASPSIPAAGAAPPSLPPRKTNGPAPPPRHPAAHAAVASSTGGGGGGLMSSANQSTNSLSGGGGGDMIANATGWEDRCWSEVVRLKESVFWARVAAVSSDGGVVSARGAKVWVQ